jgi:hypothetical protein
MLMIPTDCSMLRILASLHSVPVGAKQVPLALSTTWYHYIEMLMEIQCNQKFMVENVDFLTCSTYNNYVIIYTWKSIIM